LLRIVQDGVVVNLQPPLTSATSATIRPVASNAAAGERVVSDDHAGAAVGIDNGRGRGVVVAEPRVVLDVVRSTRTRREWRFPDPISVCARTIHAVTGIGLVVTVDHVGSAIAGQPVVVIN